MAETQEETLKKVFLMLKKSEERRKQLEQRLAEPIAIVGMACRFPGGADTPAAFWDLLAEGRDAICEVPPSRWLAHLYHDPDPSAPGKTYVSKGGFIAEPIDRFDETFFKVTPLEAERMDPQQRMLLTVCWEALEDAFIRPSTLDGSNTAVIVGLCNFDYSQLDWRSGDPRTISGHSVTGNAFSTASGRLAYFLGCEGPNFTVDTACSSTQVALHQAGLALHAGECDAAIVGAVNLILSPACHIGFSKLGALSPDGHCMSFSDQANGYSRSEGCGVVILQRLSDAVRDGRRIHGSIRGSALNQDGRSNGLTAPRGSAQSQVVRLAMARAGCKAEDIDYIETHGTGTRLGDPIEVDALAAIHGNRPADRPLLLGAVKSQVGHAEAAAGMTGLLKVLLAFRHQALPANLHCDQPNSRVAWSDYPIALVRQLTPWPRGERPRLAGLSGFSFSGANAHLILEEPPLAERRPTPASSEVLLVLSATRPEALLAQSTRLATCLTGQANLHDIAHTTLHGRERLAQRLAVVGDSADALRDLLERASAGATHQDLLIDQAGSRDGGLVFLFPGQGAQYAGMAQQLYLGEPRFRAALDHCAQLFDAHLPEPLLPVLFGERGDLIEQTRWTQPCLFATAHALAQLWLDWGLKPNGLLGHSIGELNAAVIAGIFSLEDGVRLVAERARLMGSVATPGRMEAVLADETAVASVLRQHPEVVIAAYNGPRNHVISGPAEAVAAAVADLRAAGHRTAVVRVSQAFHSPLMDEILAEFGKTAAQITYQAPTLQIFSNRDGRDLGPAMATARYWVEQIREPVHFQRGFEQACANGTTLFIEMGSGMLGQMARAIEVEAPRPLLLPSLGKKEPDRRTLNRALGRLFTIDAPIAWEQVFPPANFVDLPFYAFQERRHWFDGYRDPVLTAAAEHACLTVHWRPCPLPAAAAGPLPPLIGQPEPLAALAHDPDLTAQLGPWPDHESGLARLAAAIASREHLVLALGQTDEDPLNERGPLAQLQRLCQALARAHQAPALTVLTRGLMPAQPSDRPDHPAQALAWGLLRAAALEHPQWQLTLIDLPAHAGPNDTPSLQALLARSGHGFAEFALRDGQAFAPRLEPATTPTTPCVVKPGAWYVISGGLGSLGLATAAWLARRGATHLALLGRSGRPSTADAERTPAHAKVHQALEALEHGGVRLATPALDITDGEQLAACLSQLRDEAPIRGIVHAAGTLTTAPLAHLDWPTCLRVCAAKVLGAALLDRLSAADPLDFFVAYASIAGVWGGQDLTSYSAANAYLDALMAARRARGAVAISVAWGPFRGSGVFADVADSEALLQRNGIRMFDPSQAETLFERAFAGTDEASGLVCADIDWPRLSLALEQGGRRSLFDALRGTAKAPTTGAIAARLAGLDPTSRDRELRSYLAALIAEIGHFSGELADDFGFFEMGMDSVMTQQLRERLQNDLQLELPATLAFDHPTLQALHQHLRDQIRTETPPAASIDEAEDPEYEQIKALLAQALE